MSTDADRITTEPGDADRSPPPLIDMGDSLDRIERNTDQEPAVDCLAEIRELLDRIADRDPGERGSLLHDLDDRLVALRTHVEEGGEAESRVGTMQNRVANYRETCQGSSDTLHFEDSQLTAGGEEPVDPAEHQGEKGRLRGTLVNEGEATGATVQLAFYDEQGNASWTVESCEFELGAGERRSLDLHVWIPEDAAYYGVFPLDASDPGTTDEPFTCGR